MWWTRAVLAMTSWAHQKELEEILASLQALVQVTFLYWLTSRSLKRCFERWSGLTAGNSNCLQTPWGELSFLTHLRRVFQLRASSDVQHPASTSREAALDGAATGTSPAQAGSPTPPFKIVYLYQYPFFSQVRRFLNAF